MPLAFHYLVIIAKCKARNSLNCAYALLLSESVVTHCCYSHWIHSSSYLMIQEGGAIGEGAAGEMSGQISASHEI